MNFLFLIHRYPPAQGGSERYVQEMAHRLVAEGHRATVLTSDVLDMEGFLQRGYERLAAGVEDDAGVRVHRFPARVLPMHNAASYLLSLVPWAPIGLTMMPPGMVLPGLWQAVRAGGDFDLVHASAYPSLMYLGTVAARRTRAQLVLMPCAHLATGAQDWQVRYFLSRRAINVYRQADAIIALTERERQAMVRAGLQRECIHVTGVGVNPGDAQGADGNRFRQKLGIPAGAPVVAFVGRKSHGKGVLHLLDACQVLLAERHDLTVVIVGEPTPAFDRRYQGLPEGIRARILDLRLSEGEKQDMLAASSALLLPSEDDAFGIVLLEAWLHGKPVIGARAGGIPDVVEEERTGLLVPFGDVQALAQATAWLLDHPAEAAQMGDRGREETLRRWTWEAVYDRVTTIYECCRAKETGTCT